MADESPATPVTSPDPGSTPVPPAADDRSPLLLDELGDQLERFRILRKSDEGATDALLDTLGAHSPVDRDIVLELSATRPLGRPERFVEAHALAMRSLEVLERNGARATGAPKRLWILRPVAAFAIQLVVRFIVRSHQQRVVDELGELYARRLAWCRSRDADRLMLWKAHRDVTRVVDAYKGQAIGLPTFLLGGAAASALGSGVRSLSNIALGNQAAAAVSVVVVTLLFVFVSWVIVRGAAVARRRIVLTVERPIEALWETIGRAGRPPQDRARTIALWGVILTAASWFVVPAGVVWLLSAF